MFCKPVAVENPLTAEQKMEVMVKMLESLDKWRNVGNIQDKCFPTSFKETLIILFPNGL